MYAEAMPGAYSEPAYETKPPRDREADSRRSLLRGLRNELRQHEQKNEELAEIASLAHELASKYPKPVEPIAGKIG